MILCKGLFTIFHDNAFDAWPVAIVSRYYGFSKFFWRLVSIFLDEHFVPVSGEPHCVCSLNDYFTTFCSMDGGLRKSTAVQLHSCDVYGRFVHLRVVLQQFGGDS